MRAYMFVNALHGQSLALTRAIRDVRGVQMADPITGDYDIIASVMAADLADLREIMADVQAISGVLKTTTCMVLGD
ncbi:MAG: Lrp/AsnC ligand binding domain-containing protein [Candidatus Dormibacteraeota bacterium]|nr:Lrp/AsnC ligand binding domain-containing protein [Candidatus Dormibacteraeota bacterium]